MQEMKIRCTSQEHADRVVVAARKMGYQVIPDYMDVEGRGWDTLMLRAHGAGSFWSFEEENYPEYALYGDHLLPVSEGWIENKGECPVRPHQFVFTIDEDGTESGYPEAAGYVDWDKVVAYRLSDIQKPAKDKAELTPCQQRGLRVGQWVWYDGGGAPMSTGWVMLSDDDNSTVPEFYDPRIRQHLFGALGFVDFTQGIHDTKPDWTPGDKVQPPIPDEQIAQAAEAPVEWDGEGLPPVGADETVFVPTTAVSANYHGYKWEVVAHHNGKAVVVVSGQIASSAHMVNPSNIRPIQSERDHAVAELKGIMKDLFSPIEKIAGKIYDAGYRKQETEQ